MLQIGIILAILAAISFALSNIFSKALSTKTTAINSVLYQGFFISIFSLFFYIIFENNIEIPNLKATIGIIIGGIFGFIGIFYLFKSFQNLDVGKTLIIANTYPFLILLLSSIILKTQFSMLIIFPMLLIFIGIILLFNLKKNSNDIKKIKFPIIVSLSWGIFYFCITYISQQNLSPFGIVFYIELMLFISALIYIIFSKNKILPTNQIKNISYLSAVSGFFVMTGISLVTFSQLTINPAITSSIKSFELIITAILATLIYKEYLNFKNIIGIIIAFIGIILFNFI